MNNFFIVTVWSIVNKFFGLIRIQLTQRLLGASVQSDAFNLAFRMIAFFRNIFTDGSFYSFFIAYFVKDNKNKEDRHFGFTLGVLLIFSSIFLLISIIFFFFPLFLTKIFMMNFVITKKNIMIINYISRYVFPVSSILLIISIGFSFFNNHKKIFLISILICSLSLIFSIFFLFFPLFLTELFMKNAAVNNKIFLISQYAKYMFPLALSMFFCSVFSAILNTYGEFFHSSLGLVIGSVFNISILYLGSYNLKYIFWYFVFGTLSYSAVHALYMWLVIYKKYYLYSPPIVNKEFFHKISITGGIQLVNQIIVLLLGVLFSRMKPGGFSYTRYADSLTYFVFALVAGNLSNVVSPMLSKMKDDILLYQKTCEKIFSMTIFLVLFPTIFIFINSQIITNFVYVKNSTTNLYYISLAIKHAVICTPFWCLQRILLTFFTAKGNLIQQNISTTIHNILHFLFCCVLLHKFDFIGVIWSVNIATIAVVFYLLYAGHRSKTFILKFENIYMICSKIFIATVCIYILPICIKDALYKTILKIIFSICIYCLIFYQDLQFFIKNKI
jgi:peptidoglycan biosynthesis protein MviN/MurJ (putative lipid II flippase)